MDLLKSRVFHIFLLVVITAGVYAVAIGGGFVYDDKAMIVAYDLVKDVGNIPQAFTSSTSVYGNVNYYRPLQTITYMVDYFLWGDVPAGFHFTNILFHIAAVLMVYAFILLLFEERALGYTAALLFAVHPVHTSVVSYIAGRADAMLCVFMLVCFFFYIRSGTGRGRSVRYSLSVIFFGLALLVKETAMIIPFVIIFLDKYALKWTDREVPRTSNTRYVPFFVLLGLYIAFRVARMSFFAEGAAAPLPFGDRLVTAPYVLAQYLRLIILPNDLHIGRALWAAGSIFNARVMVSIAVLAVVYYAAYRMRNKEKGIWFGMLWFTFMIIPSLNIITPLFYTIAENWLYIPSIGLFLVIACLVKIVYDRCEQSHFRQIEYTVIAFVGLFAAAMAAITVSQHSVWQDEITLGENTLKHNPGEFKMYNNMGVLYLGRGELDNAEEAFRKCLAVKPDTGMAYFNLYRVYMVRGERKKALIHLKRARELDPQRINILVQKMGIKD